jgi:hypothetical protein
MQLISSPRDITIWEVKNSLSAENCIHKLSTAHIRDMGYFCEWNSSWKVLKAEYGYSCLHTVTSLTYTRLKEMFWVLNPVFWQGITILIKFTPTPISFIIHYSLTWIIFIPHPLRLRVLLIAAHIYRLHARKNAPGIVSILSPPNIHLRSHLYSGSISLSPNSSVTCNHVFSFYCGSPLAA